MLMVGRAGRGKQWIDLRSIFVYIYHELYIERMSNMYQKHVNDNTLCSHISSICIPLHTVELMKFKSKFKSNVSVQIVIMSFILSPTNRDLRVVYDSRK